MSAKIAKLLPVQKWEFVRDPVLQNVLIQDYRELRRIVRAGARKSAVVLCGSILEAVLVDKLTSSEGQSKYQAVCKKVMDVDGVPGWGLENQINICAKLGFLDDGAAQQAHVLQDFRNYIHPGKAMQTMARVEESTVIATIGLLNHVVKSFKPQRLKLPPPTPKDKFLKKLAQYCSQGEVEAVCRIMDWAVRNEMQEYWSSKLTYAPRLHHNGQRYTPLVIRPTGKIQIMFRQLAERPAVFHLQKQREMLRQRLNAEALGQRIPEKMIDRIPVFHVRLISQEPELTNFINILDWVAENIKQ